MNNTLLKLIILLLEIISIIILKIVNQYNVITFIVAFTLGFAYGVIGRIKQWVKNKRYTMN